MAEPKAEVKVEEKTVEAEHKPGQEKVEEHEHVELTKDAKPSLIKSDGTFLTSHTSRLGGDEKRKKEFEDQLVSLAEEKPYAARGLLDALVVVSDVTIRLGRQEFKGVAGGLVGFGPTHCYGDVYTKDLKKLFRETRQFQLTTTPVWCSVVFLDSDSKVLGNFQAQIAGLFAGFSGGKGKWKPHNRTWDEEIAARERKEHDDKMKAKEDKKKAKEAEKQAHKEEKEKEKQHKKEEKEKKHDHHAEEHKDVKKDEKKEEHKEEKKEEKKDEKH